MAAALSLADPLQPQGWIEDVYAAALRANEAELSPRQRVMFAYWQALGAHLREVRSSLRMRRVRKLHWCSFGVGQHGLRIHVTADLAKHGVSVELFLKGAAGRARFAAMQARKAAVEQAFGRALIWQDMPRRNAARIVLHKFADPADCTQWQVQHAWIAANMERFRDMLREPALV